MAADIEAIYEQVMRRARADGFAGWDPFDGLESRVFQATPLRLTAPTRFAWQQMVKRSPLNLRPLLRVPKGVNAKGLALFALAELAMFRADGTEERQRGVHELLTMLRELRIRGTAGDKPTSAFGYNFDWQSRAFFAPKGTPTIVPTAFAARAFIEAYEAFGRREDLEIAEKICGFVLGDLRRPVETDEEICFSYTPLDSGMIYNASLLAGETLAAVGAITGNTEHLSMAARSARFVIRNQEANGAWLYGPKSKHAWIDNFHTAFVLGSLKRISERVPEIREECAAPVGKGFDYWIENFFLENGLPKYFDSRALPADVHSAAAAIATLSEFSKMDDRALPLAERILEWTLTNLWDGTGNFHYQKRRFATMRIPFMRWGQAWMAYALGKLIEARGSK